MPYNLRAKGAFALTGINPDKPEWREPLTHATLEMVHANLQPLPVTVNPVNIVLDNRNPGWNHASTSRIVLSADRFLGALVVGDGGRAELTIAVVPPVVHEGQLVVMPDMHGTGLNVVFASDGCLPDELEGQVLDYGHAATSSSNTQSGPPNVVTTALAAIAQPQA